MRIDKFTQKMQEALQAAQDVASQFNHQEISNEHFLSALLDQSDGIAKPRLEQQKITLDLSDSAKALLAREGYDLVYGARPLRHTIQKEILDPLSIDILEGKVREGHTVKVDAKNGALEFREK